MLITFLVFALLAIVLLVCLLWYFIPSSRIATTVPGVRPADQIWGNLPNITDAGGLPQFLQNLHSDHGPIASFWLGDFLAISVGSHHLFKLVDKSCPKNGLPYQTIVPLTLDKDVLEKTSSNYSFLNSILSSFAPFSHLCQVASLAPQVSKLTQELCGVLGNIGSEDQVPIHDYIDALAVKIVAETSGHIKETEMPQLRLAYTNLMLELESVMEAGKEVGDIKRKLLVQRSEEFLKIVDKDYAPKIFGLISVISVLSTWVLYYLGKNKKLQSQVRKDDSLLKPFLAEVVRVTGFIPLTARVLAKQDLNLLGHTLEEGTLVIHSLSTVCWDAKVFSDPEAVSLQREMNNLPNILQMVNPSFEQSYSYCVIINIVETIIGAFNIELAAPEVCVGKKFNFVMKPDSDIWLKLQKM